MMLEIELPVKLYAFARLDQELRMPSPSHPERNDSGEIIAARDWLGNRFAVGERVIYCIHSGDTQKMAVGVVEKIESIRTRERLGWRLTPPGEQPDKTMTIDGASVDFSKVRVPYEELRVAVLTLRTSDTWHDRQRTKAAWVKPNNITAIPVETDGL